MFLGIALFKLVFDPPYVFLSYLLYIRKNSFLHRFWRDKRNDVII